MYELGKVLGGLVSPLVPAALLGALGAYLLLRRRIRSGLATLAVGAALAWVGALPATALWLDERLQRHHPAWTVEATPAADALVLLGGSMAVYEPGHPRPFGIGSSSGRIWYAAALYRAGKVRHVVVAAGSAARDGRPVEADIVADLLSGMGVPRQRIHLDRGSRNTRENAREAARLLDELGASTVLVVTAARHMPRAMAHFGNQSSSNPARLYLAAPTETAEFATAAGADSWVPTALALQDVTALLREYAGWAAATMIQMSHL